LQQIPADLSRHCIRYFQRGALVATPSTAWCRAHCPTRPVPCPPPACPIPVPPVPCPPRETTR